MLENYSIRAISEHSCSSEPKIYDTGAFSGFTKVSPAPMQRLSEKLKKEKKICDGMLKEILLKSIRSS
jgi:hypothetical protein